MELPAKEMKALEVDMDTIKAWRSTASSDDRVDQRKRRAILRVVAVCAVTLFVLPWSAGAQTQSGTSTNLAGLLPDLILREIRLAPNPVFSHDAHFAPFATGEVDNPAVGIVENFTKLIAAQLPTFPLGSSTGGLTYTFDPALGTFNRASTRFGPAFAERALTIGRGRISAGMNYQFTKYDSFEGLDLEDGSIKFYLRHQDCCSGAPPGTPPFFQPDGTRLSPFFEGDVAVAALALKANTQMVAFFGNYGVSDRWDVGIAVPLMRIELDAAVRATIFKLSTVATLAHTFEAGNLSATQKTFQRSGTATGLGDIVLRTKYRFVEGGHGALATAVDLRLPTGDQKDLLGVGTQGKVYLIFSSENGSFGEHVNVGYTFARGTLPAEGGLATLGRHSEVPDEFNYTAGVELAHGRVTIVADLIGRTLRDAGRLKNVAKTFQFQPFTPVTPTPSVQFDEFDPQPGHLNLLLGTAGAKGNLAGNLLASANVLFPITQAGLRSRVTIVLGLDYALQRDFVFSCSRE